MADQRAWLGDFLALVEAAPPVESVAVMARALERQLAAVDVSFLITDFSGRAVVRLIGAAVEGGRGQPERVELSGTAYDQVIRSQEVLVESDKRAGEGGSGPVRVIAPVADRGDAIGLLELTLPAPPDWETVQRITEFAHVLAYVIIVNRRFTDLYQWGRRTTRPSLAAEIQHRLLPDSFTCEAGPFTVAAALEPAHDIGGDTFDYTLDRRALYLSLTDAMGHDVQAALLATVAVSALRNARRAGADLAAQAVDAHQAVVEQIRHAHLIVGDQSEQAHRTIAEQGGQVMVTGQLLRVALDTGQTAFVNAGHIWPLRLRGGKVQEVKLSVDLPFGVTPNAGYHIQNLDLRPGDRLVLFTDGMLEPDGTDLGLRNLIEQTGDWHPRDAVRTFTEAVLEATHHDPRDDATVLCLDWPG